MEVKQFIKSSIICGLLSTTFVVNADVTIVKKDGTTVFLSKNMMKVQDPQQPNYSNLIDIDNGLISNVDHKHKEYVHTTLDETCNTQKKMASLISQFRKEDKSKVTINVDKKNVTIAGYPTTKYKVFEGDELKEIVWISSDTKLMNELKMYYIFEEKINCMGDVDYSSSDKHKELMKTGIPLKSYAESDGDINEDDFDVDFSQPINEDDDNGVEYFEVAKVNFSDISASTFQVPADYKKITTTQFMQRQFSEANDAEGKNEGSENNELSAESQQEAIDKLTELVGEESALGTFLSDALDGG